MKQLSKYALKQLTEDERMEYYAQLKAEEDSIRRVSGGEIRITESADGDYYLESFDLDNCRVRDTFCYIESLEDEIELMEEELADIQDCTEEEW